MKYENGINHRIKEIRKSLNMSMEEFGKLFDPVASKGVVSNWENNYNYPNKKRLEKIASLGNMTMDELLYGYNPGQLSDKLKDYFGALEEFKREQLPIKNVLLSGDRELAEKKYNKYLDKLNKKYDLLSEEEKKFIESSNHL